MKKRITGLLVASALILTETLSVFAAGSKPATEVVTEETKVVEIDPAQQTAVQTTIKDSSVTAATLTVVTGDQGTSVKVNNEVLTTAIKAAAAGQKVDLTGVVTQIGAGKIVYSYSYTDKKGRVKVKKVKKLNAKVLAALANNGVAALTATVTPAKITVKDGKVKTTYTSYSQLKAATGATIIGYATKASLAKKGQVTITVDKLDEFFASNKKAKVTLFPVYAPVNPTPAA